MRTLATTAFLNRHILNTTTADDTGGGGSSAGAGAAGAAGAGAGRVSCSKVTVGGFGPSARAAHAMCTINGKAAVFGGRDSVGRTKDLFYLLPPGFDGMQGWTWSKPPAAGQGG